MASYIRNQSRFKPLTQNDTPQMRAAVNLVMAFELGASPNLDDLAVLAEAFAAVFGGESPLAVFGHPLGLTTNVGRPKNSGISPSVVVSAVIELELRRLGIGPKGLPKAIEHAQNSFVDSTDARTLRRDWTKGKSTVQDLCNQTLHDLIAPYSR